MARVALTGSTRPRVALHTLRCAHFQRIWSGLLQQPERHTPMSACGHGYAAVCSRGSPRGPPAAAPSAGTRSRAPAHQGAPRRQHALPPPPVGTPVPQTPPHQPVASMVI
eukprot:1135286-Prorocentrum_minimum.AAC.4